MEAYNHFRGNVRKVVDSRPYTAVILFFILANSVQLILHGTWDGKLAERVFSAVDGFFLIIFTIELVLGLIAYGFGYLTSFWPILDLVIVVTGWVTVLSPAHLGLSGLRALRVLRPLRSISRIESVKVLVETLGLALPAALNVTLLLLIFWYLLALIGVQLWMGALHRRCYTQIANTTMFELVPDQDWACTASVFGRQCGDQWLCLEPTELLNVTCHARQDTCPYKELTPTYDDIGQSLIINIMLLSQDDWSFVMLQVMNGWGDAVWIYFVVMTTIGIIVTNLFVGVLYTQFAKLQSQMRERKAAGHSENSKINQVGCSCPFGHLLNAGFEHSPYQQCLIAPKLWCDLRNAFFFIAEEYGDVYAHCTSIRDP